MERFGNSLKFGLIAGVILMTISILTYAFKIDQSNMMLSFLMAIIMYGVLIAFTIIVMSKARSEYEDYSYGKGFLVGFVMLLVAFYLSAIYSFIFDSYIDPDYTIQTLNKTIETLESNAMISVEMIDQIYEDMVESIKPTNILVKNLWVSPIISAVMSAIIALFIRKKKEIE
ncbi:MAG: DUF4199 domain-containing protein [Lentimicrobiaceae bacterium]|jgi:hypothetical protein|nr:DUF4199 domain-containing protein [Lentimicrobiaceae bacterium]